MNFTRKILDFAKKHFTPPRPQKAPKLTQKLKRLTLSSLNEMRRRSRLGCTRVRGAFGKTRVHLVSRSAKGAARGPRPHTWWKQQRIAAQAVEAFVLRAPRGLHAV